MLSSLLLIIPPALRAEEPDSVRLRELTVRAQGRGIMQLSGGNMRVSTEQLRRRMRVMGEADVVNALKRIGGISTVGDYGSGLIIQGDDPSQTVFCIDRAPVFFPYRFGGVFSAFNTTHFTSATLLKSAVAAPTRLGAMIDLAPRLDYSAPIGGNLNVGLLASTLSLRTGAAGRFALSVSGRISYIDQIYGKLLRGSEQSVRYRFSDVNVSAGWRIDSLNVVTANYFINGDRLSMGNALYAMTTRLRWRNNVGSLSWRRPGASVGVYLSEFAGTMTVAIPQSDVTARNSIVGYGLTGTFDLWRREARSVELGAEISGYRITPLWAEVVGPVAQNAAQVSAQTPLEIKVFSNARLVETQAVSLMAGLAVSAFDWRFMAVSPSVSLAWRRGGNIWDFSAGLSSQYLHQVGFSDIGLASNFWYGSCGDIKPQRSLNLDGGWKRAFFDRQLLVSVSAYLKRVIAQPEYQGRVFDVINPDYTPDANLFAANGYNCGVALSTQKNFGALTGSVGYSFGYAVRRAGGVSFRSLTDAGHQLKADAEYQLNDHWSVGAAFTFASGRVYTPANYIYLIANHLMVDNGKRNSARMPAYQRLDLSATYSVGRHSVNVSLLNAYGHRNIEVQYFGINRETGRYRLYGESSLYRFLPSVSYCFDF